MRILRKYANRRLYDTSKSSYVTLEDVKLLVLASEPFQVVDSKNGDDLTRNILLQIISEQETDGHGTLLTNQVLQQLIRFYGDSMHGMLSQFLEQSLAAFLDQQDKLKKQAETMNPVSIVNQLIEQNLSMWKMLAESVDPKKWSEINKSTEEKTKDDPKKK